MGIEEIRAALARRVMERGRQAAVESRVLDVVRCLQELLGLLPEDEVEQFRQEIQTCGEL